MPNEQPIDFSAILARLSKADVRFVVIGGVALHLHGASNVTYDVDVSFARDTVNLTALADTLASQNARPRDFPPGLPFILDARTLRNVTTLTLETDLGDFDLLAEPEGVDSFEGLWERATVMEIEGRGIRVASLDDLATMKRAAGRDRDRDHLRMIDALKRLKNEEAGREG